MERERPAAAPGSPDELVRRAARGDAAAFARIVRLHHEAMTRCALVVTGDPGRAVAATEAALRGAWTSLRRPRTPARLDAWLCARAAAEAVRFERGEIGHVAFVGGGSAEPAPTPAPAAVAALEPLAGLVPEDRALLALDHAGLSRAEIAAALHRPEFDVTARLASLGAGFAVPLAAAGEVAIRPLDADTVARRARAAEVEERRRVISVAVSVVVGFLVVAHPYLAELLFRR